MSSSTSSSSHGRARPSARTLLLLLAGLLYALGFAEGYLRVFGSRYIGVEGRSCIHPPYDFKKLYGAPFQTNGWGLRGRDFEQGVLRVVTFGGSATEAAELTEEDSWSGRLETDFNAIAGTRLGQVVNAGMSGAASAHYLAHLRELSGPLGIDVAVIYTGINDADRLARYGKILEVSRVGDASYAEAFFQAFSRPDPTRFASMPVSPLMQHARLALFLKSFVIKSVSQPFRNRFEDLVPGRSLEDKRVKLRASAAYPEILRQAGMDYAHNILLMIEVARDFKVTPLFVTMPLLSEEADPELPVLNAALLKVCRRERVPYVDLAARPPPAGESWFGHAGRHLGKAGSARAGRILAEKLADLLYGDDPAGAMLRRRARDLGLPLRARSSDSTPR